jgi:signal transduction histidine kinase/FixJ family two-component response regulator
MTRRALERFVLCVDDDEDFLKSLEGFLPRLVPDPDQGIRYQFLYVSDPRQALKDLDELVRDGETVAMFITDHQMPTMKGLEFLSEARRRVPDSHRVLLTGHAGIESAIEAINEKLLDKYITKPIYDENEFSLNIRHLLQNFELRRTIGRQSETIRKLYDFATELHACENLAATLEHVVRFTADALSDAPTCVALTENGRIGVSATRGMPSLDPARYGPFPPASPTAATSELTNVGLVPGIGSALSAVPEVSSLDWIHVPIVAEGRWIGIVCSAVRDQSQSVVEVTGATLGYVANTASMAIHNQMNRLQLERAYVAEKAHASALDETNQRLKSLDRMKNDFLSFISHELRTPLNFMAALALVDDASDTEERDRMLSIARSGYDRLERFVTRGLEYFDWIGTPSLAVAEDTDLSALVTSVVTDYRSNTDDDRDLELVTPVAPCPIAMDVRYARQLLHILLDNAIKFSDGQPFVRVEVADHGAEVTLVVTDRGRGFVPDMAAQLFQPFTTAHAKQHREGSALSLAIAAAIVEAHGGHIEARSLGQDRGASFIVTLPHPGSAEKERPTDDGGSDSLRSAA